MAQTGQPSSTNIKKCPTWLVGLSFHDTLSMGVSGPEPPCNSKEGFSYWTLRAGSWQSNTSLQVNLQLVSNFHQFKTRDFQSGIQSCVQSHSSRANTDNIATIQVFRDNTLHTLEIQLSCSSYSSLNLEIYLGLTHYSFECGLSYGKHQSHLKVQLGMVQGARMSKLGWCSTAWAGRSRSGVKWCAHVWIKPKQICKEVVHVDLARREPTGENRSAPATSWFSHPQKYATTKSKSCRL